MRRFAITKGDDMTFLAQFGIEGVASFIGAGLILIWSVTGCALWMRGGYAEVIKLFERKSD